MKIENIQFTPALPRNFLPPIQRRASGRLVPLTDNQVHHWKRISEQYGCLSPRLRAAAMRLLGPLNVSALRSGIGAIVQRHESLRTSIAIENGSPAGQHIDDKCDYQIEEVDLSATALSNAQREANLLAAQFFARKIDVRVDPLFAAMLLRISDSEHVLLLALDHMIGDGASCAILSKEILASYDHVSHEVPLALPDLPVQFADYAVWLQQTRSARLAKDGPYWAARTIHAQTARVPTQPQPAEVETPTSAILNLPFGKTLSSSLRDMARRERTLLPIIVLTVYLIAMSRWCGRSDWPVLFVSHGRYRRAELQNMIGFLSTAFHFRIEVSNSDSLIDILHCAHAEFSNASDHQDYVPPLPAQINYAQVFNWGGLVTYSARWSIDQQRKAVSGLRVQPFAVDLRVDREFYPNFSDTPAGIVATVHYRRDLLTTSTIERLGRNMRTVAKELSERPLMTVGSLPLDVV